MIKKIQYFTHFILFFMSMQQFAVKKLLIVYIYVYEYAAALVHF
jgi:hypothetical protein